MKKTQLLKVFPIKKIKMEYFETNQRLKVANNNITNLKEATSMLTKLLGHHN